LGLKNRGLSGDKWAMSVCTLSGMVAVYFKTFGNSVLRLEQRDTILKRRFEIDKLLA
jgi:hypothetical protein